MENTFFKILNAILIPLLCWGILIFSMQKDRSRYRNTAFLGLAVLTTIPVVMLPFRDTQVPVILSFLLILLILVVPFMLIANGILMIRREGHRLADLLSLLLGIIILLGELAVITVVVYPYYNPDLYDGHFFWSKMPVVLMLFSVTVIYGSLVFVAFMFYTLFLQIIPVRRDFDYVIIHGSGLIHGNNVPRLLADRLDKAIRIYHKDPTPPIMIPSGGQGSDETIAEGDAMARYLREHGIPEDHILIENKSMNTFQNLENCKKLIDERTGRKYTVLVTSNYHVYRALRYARDIGLKCTGVGSRVAPYYWPSALIREFVAIHSEKKHRILFIAGWLLCMIPLFLSAVVR